MISSINANLTISLPVSVRILSKPFFDSCSSYRPSFEASCSEPCDFRRFSRLRPFILAQRKYATYSKPDDLSKKIKGPPESSRESIIKAVRQKIDPRLAYLLSLSKSELYDLKKRDNEKLDHLAVKIVAASKRIMEATSEQVRQKYSKELHSVKKEIFAPLSHGLYLPELEAKRDLIPPGLFKKPFISAFIVSGGSAKDLQAMGVKVRCQSGDIFTAFIPLDLISQLEARSSIRYIQLSQPLFPNLDVAIPYTQIKSLHKASSPITGQGVIVGIIDGILDVHHPDFSDASGNSRILFIWDQSLTAIPGTGEASPPVHPVLPNFTPVNGTSYGVEYDRADINTERTNFTTGTAVAYQTVRHKPTDPEGEHGTHVASIVAGNGSGQAGTFTGGAPDSEIIFSNAFSNRFLPFSDAAYVQDAFSYIFSRASQLNRPCVINMSLGNSQGPHDGSNPGQQFLANLLDVPGRAVTIAAGNATGARAHATGTVTAGATTNLILNYQSLPNPTAPGTLLLPSSDDLVEIWYDGHDDFSIRLITPPVVLPGSPLFTPPAPVTIGPVAPGGIVTQNLGDVSVTMISKLSDPRNQDNLISIFFTVNNNSIPLGNWTFALSGTTIINGHFQAWVERNNRYHSRWIAPHVQDGASTIDDIGSTRRAIIVANHNKTAPIPGISGSSGLGPTRDGRMKPDIAAVGTNVTAARSRDMTLSSPGALYVQKSGTSMAAPLTAGALALLFQCRGANASWADLKMILQQTAGAAGPQNTFGSGYLQMGTACTVPQPRVDVWVRDGVDDTGLEPYTGNVAHICPDVEILDAVGQPVFNPTHDGSVRYNNLIRVTVNNRGTELARQTEVYLYWADPSTHIPFPSGWYNTGIYTDLATTPGTYTELNNKIVIPEITGGGSVPVTFAWNPPATGSSIAGDSHFCLLVRVEHDQDPSGVGAGSFDVIRAHNNIGLRNVTVQELSASNVSSFYVQGTEDTDSLIITTEGIEGEFELILPSQTIPVRDAKLIEKFGDDALYKYIETYKTQKEEVTLLHDIYNADQVYMKGKGTSVTWNHTGKVRLQQIKLRENQRIPARIGVKNGNLTKEKGFIHVQQYSGGRRMGGVSLELRAKK